MNPHCPLSCPLCLKQHRTAVEPAVDNIYEAIRNVSLPPTERLLFLFSAPEQTITLQVIQYKLLIFTNSLKSCQLLVKVFQTEAIYCKAFLTRLIVIQEVLLPES